MRKSSCWMLAVCVSGMLGISGCGIGNMDLGKELIHEATPTPEPETTPVPEPSETAAPLPTPAASPAPVSTATPTPWRIGTKTSQSSFVYLTNSTNEKIRQVYLMSYGGSDWGKNLVPSESAIRASEQVQLCYTPIASENGQTVASYSLKFVTQSGNVYQLDDVPLQDMQQAVLHVENEAIVLHYSSLGEKTEKTINGSGADFASWDSQNTDYEDSYDDSYYDDSYYDDSYDDDTYYDDSYEDQYDDYDYSDESYYDEDEDYSYDDEEYN